MATSWYQCEKCSTTIKKDSTPSSFNCPSGSMHKWTKLAEVGDINYQCRKCGTTIQAKSSPSSFGCPNGSMHSWTKL